uniref:Uncharacterized protein n=1 Tax=Panagrolaimus davidi TaxID=227884 RepID=A0A914QT60_9BILA
MTGKALAGTVGFPIPSKLCQMQNFGGWKLVFYVFAGIGALWTAIWFWYAFSTPAHHKYINKNEEEYIRGELKRLDINHNPNTTKLYYGSVPWKKICTSKAIYINLICQFTFNFSEAILSAYLPTYLSKVLQVNLNTNGYLAMLSFFVQLIFQVFFGAVTDFIHKRELVSSTTCCKIFQAGGIYRS